MAVKYNKNGEWISTQNAIETSLIDIENNFESNTVEGALSELNNKLRTNISSINGTLIGQSQILNSYSAKIESNENAISSITSKVNSAETKANTAISKVTAMEGKVNSLSSRMLTAEEDIEWLKVNGGGGGGTATPTITSTFKDCAIDKGTDVIIPIFFSSPNMGTGTAYISVNNIQVDTAGLSQGNNNVKLLGKYLLNQTDNTVSIYAKDRAGIVSNLLSWQVISGGIELINTFDYEVDYGITDTIRLSYKIDTGIRGTIKTRITIDGISTEYNSTNGDNFIDLLASNLGLGTHGVSMFSTVDKYVSKTINYNLVIVSTTELFLSSTFANGSEYDYGQLINVNYRLSKKSTEEFNVYLKIDDNVVKTQKIPIGNYYWTINNLSVGSHKLTIQAVSLDYLEDKSIELQINIVEGSYVPIEDYKLGLLCDLNAVGKTNNDDNVTVWRDESGNGNNGKLINFNFGTNGFINDSLICDNDAYVEIPFSPWKDNAHNGSTFDLIYEPINSGIEDCRVLDYTTITDNLSQDPIKPFKGVFADILMTVPSSASSGSASGRVNLDDESGEIHLTWVLDRNNKFFKVYLNGTLCRIMFLTDSGTGVNKFYEDFAIDEKIYLNSRKGLNCGTNTIKRFRVYDHALTSEQVLQNNLANIKDFVKQKEQYDFNYNNTNLPKMYLNGDITNMTPYQSVPMKVEYISPNEEKYGRSFNTGIQNNPVLIQGTSSLQYVRHNYTIYLKDEYGADMLYNPYGSNSVAENVFCLKADYIESSHANNTGLAKFVNDCVYDTKTPSQLDNPSCRTTISGFPVEVYINGEYLGVYNFNHDRYSTKSFGYDYNKFSNQLVYEINSNSNTSAGAFYRYGDDAQSSANVTELEYYKRDFNLIYGNRTKENDTLSEIKSLVEWVAVAERDLFKEGIEEHFNLEYLMRYYLTVLLIGAVDSLGKNMKLNTWDGKIWYPTFYDMDTCLGINNTGYLTIQPDVEIEVGSYNTSNSKLWTKLWEYFNVELKEEWKQMRNGSFTLENLMKYVYDEQIKVIPPKFYNDDAQVKYLDFGSLYTFACHGNKEHQLKRWLRERIAYVDSMLGYFDSVDDMVTVRMNKTGLVTFDITPYVPLYFSVKWSNASGGTQTFKLKRGEKKTYYFNSTVATDQEVVIYHAKHIKRIDNLTNLNPKSCLLSNAKKLTNVEIHSPILFEINVTGNKFLRTINLEGCTDLGTIVGTSSSLNLSNCKYLSYCNVYNTNLTEIQLNTSGGSLKEIYYPKSVQSINLIKQRLLEIIGLPYGTNSEEVPTSLYTISIQECPSIKKLNTSTDNNINFTFASMKYCNNLTIRNSLDLTSLRFDGFYRLKTVIIENMYNLKQVGFTDMLPSGDTPTLKYIGLSNCPLLTDIALNCTSNDYRVAFDSNAILNLGGLLKLKNISSNCVISGLKTIVVPKQLESMFFTNEYGTGYSSVANIWVSDRCQVSTSGATPTAIHVQSGYVGIDFLGMNLKNIDLGALVNIPKAINFSLSPTNTNPNFNKNRDGTTYPYLQPEGILDLSNYTESLARFFNGVDLDKLAIICNNSLPQTDLSYCFYNSTFSSAESISTLLSQISGVTNLDYCFYRTNVPNTNVLSNINFGTNASMNYTFAECANITTLSNLIIPEIVTSVEGMFSGCPITTVNNATVNVRGSIKGLFKGCDLLQSISILRIPNVTDVSNLFQGCISLNSLSSFSLPTTLINIDNLFNGCYSLVSLNNFTFGDKITSSNNWHPNNLETITNITILNSTVKLTNISTLTSITDLRITTSNITDFFTGTTNLVSINGLTVNGTLNSTANLFKDRTFNTFLNISFAGNILDMSSMFENARLNGVINLSSTFTNVNGVTNATKMFANSNISTIYMPNSFGSNANLTEMFKNCINISSADITLQNGIGTTKSMFEGCTLLSGKIPSVPSTVQNAERMFYGCTSLILVENWSFSGVYPQLATNGLFVGTGLETIRNITLGSSTSTNKWLYGIFEGLPTLKYVYGLTVTGSIEFVQRLFYQSSNLERVENLYIGGNVTYLHDGNDNANLAIFSSMQKLLYAKIEVSSKVVRMCSVFNGCIALAEVDLKMTENVTSTRSLFASCYVLPYDKINLNGWTGSNVTVAQSMFSYCKAFVNVSPVFNFAKVTTVAGMFDNCASLVTLDLTNVVVSSPLINYNNLVTNCSQLVEITMFGNMIQSQATYLSTVFSACSKLTTIRNWKITQSVTSCDWMFCTIAGFNISNLQYTPGLELNSQSVVDYQRAATQPRNCLFRWSNVKGISEITFGGNVTNISNFFEECNKMLTDIPIPAHIINVSNMFKNCTSMKSVVSNWNKTYTNVITTTGCYSGCTGITTIDGVNVIAYQGDNGLDYLPTEWGGNGFDQLTTTVIEVSIPTDNYNFRVGFYYNMRTKEGAMVNYGDGSVEQIAALNGTNQMAYHTYAKAGTYKVKGHFFYGNGLSPDCKSVITKVFQMSRLSFNTPYYLTYAFNGLNNLTYCDISNFDFSRTTTVMSVFTDCSNLVEIVGIEKLASIMDRVTDLTGAFNRCSKLLQIKGLENWNTANVVYMTNVFYSCKALTNISEVKNWNTTKVTNMSGAFQGTNIVTMDFNFNLASCTNISYMFSGCSELINAEKFNSWNLSSVTRFDGVFSSTPKLTHALDFSSINKERTYGGNIFGACGATNFTGINGLKLSGHIHGFFKDCQNVTELDLSVLDTSKAEWVGEAWTGVFYGNTKLQTVNISNLKNGAATTANLQYVGMKCPNLKTVISNGRPTIVGGTYRFCEECPSITDVDLSGWDFSVLADAAGWNKIFRGAKQIVNFKAPVNIQCNFDFNESNVISVDSLMSIINNLLPVQTTKTLNIGSVNVAKLTAAQIKIATDKNWSVV